MLSLSIITPVYNRKNKVLSSIKSSLSLVQSGYAEEIIVVDDASSDGSYECIEKHFSEEIAQGWVKLYKLPENIGVTGAKNFGARQASGEYLAFMDSDDVFLNNAGFLIHNVIKNNQKAALFFFRCSDMNSGEQIGPKLSPRIVGLRYLLSYGTPGECLPVIARSIFCKYQYDEKLRGCESLTYYYIANAGFLTLISDEVVRNYCNVGDDRLSAKKNINRRAKQLLVYNVKTLRFFLNMDVFHFVKVCLKIGKYSILMSVNYLKNKFHD